MQFYISAAIAFVMLAAAMPAFAQEEQGSEDFAINMLAMGGGCGAKEAVLKDGSKYIADYIKSTGKYDDKINSDVIFGFIQEKAGTFRSIAAENGGKLLDKPCSYYRQLAEAFVNEKGEWLKPAKDEKPEAEEEDGPDPKAIRQQLEEVTGELPKGKLKIYVGCWSSTLEKWKLQACLTEDGDRISMKLVGPAGTVCDLDDGQARKRGDGFFVYAYASSGKCSDGRAIEHFEGLCADENKSLKCLFSIFHHSNKFFLGEEGNEDSVLNGEVEMTRSE